jgi:hypothetical protein
VGCWDLAGQKPIGFRLLSRSSLKLILWERTSMKLAAVSLTKTRPPSANMPVRAEAWGISKKPPITDFCLGVDDPKPDRLREDRRHLILFQLEDHRRAVPRCGADWGPIPSHGLSRHSRFNPARGPSGEPSWERPQREPDRHLHSFLSAASGLSNLRPPSSGVIPVFQHVEEETRHGFLPAGVYKPVGRSLVRWSKNSLVRNSAC